MPTRRRAFATTSRPRIGTEAPLVIDLTRATFIDSTIVGVMLESLKQYEQLHRQFLLLLPDDAAPEVHRLFELTGLASLMPVVEAGRRRRSRTRDRVEAPVCAARDRPGDDGDDAASSSVTTCARAGAATASCGRASPRRGSSSRTRRRSCRPRSTRRRTRWPTPGSAPGSSPAIGIANQRETTVLWDRKTRAVRSRRRSSGRTAGRRRAARSCRSS